MISMPTAQIPLLVPDMPTADEIIPYLRKIDTARWYTNFGPLNAELESRLAALHVEIGPSLVAQTVANATLGIELALMSLDLPPRSKILVPAVTFPATVAAVVRAGHLPVICDVDPLSWLLTPEIALQAAKKVDLVAAIPVCAYGCPHDARAWDAFADQTGIQVVIDAAGAFGNQRSIGRSSTVFSLHATKSLGAGEGGFVIAGDTSLVQRVRRLSNFGIDVSTGYVLNSGTNAKLSEYHAAVALAALDRWQKSRANRIVLHQLYVETLRRWCPDVTLQQRSIDGVYTIMPVLLPAGCKASGVLERMAALGLQTRRWYCPTIQNHPAYANCELADSLQVASELNERLLGLPFFPGLLESKINLICHCLSDALRADT